MSEKQTTDDLAALAAAAQGTVFHKPVPQVEDTLRAAKVAALKAKYQAGELDVDPNALASKLVDALLEDGSVKGQNDVP